MVLCPQREEIVCVRGGWSAEDCTFTSPRPRWWAREVRRVVYMMGSDNTEAIARVRAARRALRASKGTRVQDKG